MMKLSRQPRPIARIRPLSLLIALAIAISTLTGAGTATLAQDATPLASPLATPVSGAIERVPFMVDLGDFATAAELTYPAGASGPFPTVILIPGSGPADMDFTVRDYATGAVRSTIFLDIADYLSTHGYAVVRYNKHYVGGPDDLEGMQEYYQNFTFDMLLADAQSVYQATSSRPEVDPERIALYGWSEGATVAVQLALAEPEIAALILQGPPDARFQDLFAYQSRVLAVDFLTEVADADQDGQVSLDELFAAYARYPGTVGSFAILIGLDLTSSQADPRFNPAVDANADGRLDIEAEVIPYLDQFFARFDEASAAGESPYGPQYASDQELPTILDSVTDLQQPILVLQGENDANVPVAAAERIDAALAEAGHPDHTLNIYPGLGHSLGPAATIHDDNFSPIAPEPLADVVSWLDAHLGGD